jgi:hypothetical protein
MEAQDDIQNKQIEIFKIAPSNAIVNPWTMMVHLQDAHATNSAVMCPVRLIFATPLARSSVA